jgi:putative ABC transport system permease protein
MAERIWPGEDPLGKRISWADTASMGQLRTVVGVAADTRYRELVQSRPTVYVPMSQQQYAPAFLLVRGSQPPSGLVPALRHAVREVDPDLTLLDAMTMHDLLGRPLTRPRFNAGVLAAFAVAAVLLTCLGLYSLTSFVIAQRRREIGIRLALGAESHRIVGLFLKRGMVPVAVGAAAGASVALIGGRALASLVYGVETGDAATLLAAVLGFVLIALAAILIATRGAARTDPRVALRPD